MTDAAVPDFAALLDWIEDRLPPAEAERVARYVADAADATRAEVDWLRSFRALSAATQFADPPADLHARLLGVFPASTPAPLQTVIRRVVAVLTYDSDTQPQPAGVRAADTSTAQRQLIYSTDIADIAVNLVPGDALETVDVYGQVLPKAAAVTSVRVQLQRHGHDIAGTTADDLGEWTFDALAQNTYDLLLSAGDIDVLIPSVPLHV